MSKLEKFNRTDFLATERTILTNDRTLLAFIRTFLSFLAGGIACVKFLDHSFFFVLGIIFLILSPVTLIFGFYRYKKINNRIVKQDIGH